MLFRKERNLIVAYDGVIKMGSWNISTGQFIGKSGKPVRTVPTCFTYKNLPSSYSRNDVYGAAVRIFREWMGTWNYDYNAQRAARFEQLISVGLRPAYFDALDDTIALTKELVEYLNAHNGGKYDRNCVNNYLSEKKYNNYLANKPDWLKRVFMDCISNVPYEFLKTFLNRMDMEHITSYITSLGPLANMTKRYYDICINLYGSAEVKPNLLSNYAHLLYLEAEYKKQHYDEILNKNNNKEWLYYQNESFVVRPLLTQQAFHDEGTNQNNCVERMYMERVYKGITHVVTVRRVNDPDKNYITCEVNNSGKIIQYLIKNNRLPTDEDAKQFKYIYQDYLDTQSIIED